MKKETIWHDEEVKKGQKQEEFECDCCGRVLTPTQMKIEKKINTELSPCFCNIIIELDKKNKLIKKLKKVKEIKTETRKSKSGKTYRRKTTSKRIRR